MKCTYMVNCEGEPVASYEWPWGDKGLACSRCLGLIRQLEQNLKRQCSIVAIQSGAPAPIERQERIDYQARILALTAECDEAKTRGLELYRSVESLQNQVKLERAKLASVTASLEMAVTQNDALRVENGELRQSAARENDELQRLRALVTLPTEPAEPTQFPEDG